ncbi:MAG: hypothetical protein KIS81_00140 [Maricaulaceae bacterium]|nr:hypothetical protein [Maricaulaceae bacterium]
MIRLTVLALAALALAGCETPAEDAGRNIVREALNARDCEPARASDAAAPGEWICGRDTDTPRARPRHRVTRQP